MSIILTHIIILPITSSIITLSKFKIALMTFIKYQDLMLGTLNNNLGTYIIIYITKTIRIYEQLFTL